MKFLVVGASGFLGGHLFRHIGLGGHKCIGTRCHKEVPGLTPFNLKEDRILDGIPLSFFSGEKVFAILSSFVSQIDDCFRERHESRRANVEGMIRLVDDLHSVGAVPVFVSSSFVFDGRVGHYREESPVNPISEYGRHKAAVEKHIRENTPRGLILRCDKIVGDDVSEEHLFSQWVRCVREGRPIDCIKGQMISPTFVDDVARAIVVACEKQLAGVYHLANPESFLREELARTFLNVLGFKADVRGKTQEELGFLDLRPLKSCLDSSKFIQSTRFQFTAMGPVFESFGRSVGLTPAGPRGARGT